MTQKYASISDNRRARAVGWASPLVLQWLRDRQLQAGGDPSAIVDEPFRFMRIREVESRTGLTRSSIYRRIQQKAFPSPVLLDGQNALVSGATEIAEWQEIVTAQTAARFSGLPQLNWATREELAALAPADLVTLIVVEARAIRMSAEILDVIDGGAHLRVLGSPTPGSIQEFHLDLTSIAEIGPSVSTRANSH
ncbi:MAG: AlpA family phage regulatory protein [Gammaproteobacteria bacterium]